MEAGEKKMNLLTSNFEEYNNETEEILSSEDNLIKLKKLIARESEYKQLISYIEHEERYNPFYANFTQDKINEIIDEYTSGPKFTLAVITSEMEKLEILQRNGLLPSEKHPLFSINHTAGFKKTIDFSNTKLLEQLKPYFQNCSSTDLKTIIEHKQLPIGRSQILWAGTKADAIRFVEHFEITKAQFNKIFYFADKVVLHTKHKDKIGTTSPLSDILKNYTI
jgi:hypothetical protein